MFSFDQAQLPKIQVRKAFIGVDFQTDFTDEAGALAATEPHGFVGRATELAEAFRSRGHTVIWTKTEPVSTPVSAEEQIMASDSAAPVSTRTRRRTPEVEALLAGPPDPEAFLSHDEPTCLKPDTAGVDISAEVKNSIPASDIVLAKSSYSAFKDTQLLRVLRSKMVMEVFICGSLANIGVYATAIDAAGHGMSITIVEDCCGYRSEARRAIAFSRLSDLTGCEMESAEAVRKTLSPPPGKSVQSSDVEARGRRGKPESSMTKETTDLVEDLSQLRLEADDEKPGSPEPNAEQTSPNVAAKIESETNSQASSPQDSKSLAKRVSSAIRTNGVGEDKKLNEAQDRATATKAQTETGAEEAIAEMIPEKAQSSALKNLQGDGIPTQKAAIADEQSQKGLCAGDTDVIDDALPEALEAGAFEKLEREVSWQRMSHQGGEVPRLVAVQGEIGEDGSIPVYRHPSDEAPPLLAFSPTVLAIKKATEKHLGHPLNHVLIQFYRDGTDYISEHSDKTIDVVQGSYIANVSLGAQRTMVFRTKRQPKEQPRIAAGTERTAADPQSVADREKTSNNAQEVPPTQSAEPDLERAPVKKAETAQDGTRSLKSTTNGEAKRLVQRATLRHNSLCRMGLQTNMKWLHSIRQDKRADRDKSAAELAFGGKRISLTFRRIGTFLSHDERKIWGQGATGKTIDEAHAVINGESTEMVEMLKAFGKENHSSSFDWSAHYGRGFDVLHMSNAPRFFASRDGLVNMRIALMLAEYGVGYAKGSMTASKTCNLDDDQLEAASVKFVDSDVAKSSVQGDMAIMLYLHSCYGPSAPDKNGEATSKPDIAKHLTRFQKALTFLTRWRRIQKAPSRTGGKPDLKVLKEELSIWNSSAQTLSSDEAYMNGETPGLVDFALWPVLHDVLQVCGKDALNAYPNLRYYVEKFAERKAVKAVMTPVEPVVVDTANGAVEDTPKSKE